MKHTFYTAGYQGHNPEALRRLAVHHNAGIVDVRFRTQSRDPRWRYAALAQLMGLRYAHLAVWGDTRHKAGPPVHIADFEGGLRWLTQWAFARPYTSLILLCQCQEAECSHRTELAQRLRDLGLRVAELDWRQSLEPANDRKD